MRDSENPELFPMQERKAVDVYAHRLARNSVLSDVAAVAAADALAGRMQAPAAADAPPPGSAALAGAGGSGEEGHADEDQGGQQQHRHTDPIPDADSR
jgi:hypothetical protein